jgi:hypothetical protein
MQRALKSNFPDVFTPEFDRRVAYHYVAPEQNAWYASFGLYRLYRRLEEVRSKLRTGPLLGGHGSVFLPARQCRQSVPDDRLVKNYPALDGSIEEYRKNLAALIENAKRYNAEIIFATQPTLWQQNMPEHEKTLLLSGSLAPFGSSGCDHPRYYSPAALERALGEFNQAMRSVCSERGVTCVDLERRVPKIGRYFFDDMHFTNAGAEFVAAAVEPAVEQSLRRHAAGANRR